MCRATSTFNWKQQKSTNLICCNCDTTLSINGWWISACTLASCTSCLNFITITFRWRKRSIWAWCGAFWCYSFHCKSSANTLIALFLTDPIRLVFYSKLLTSLTFQYFRSDESISERSTCIVTGLTYLLLSMIILIVDENTLETGLEQAYRSFNESASVFMDVQGVSSS